MLFVRQPFKWRLIECLMRRPVQRGPALRFLEVLRLPQVWQVVPGLLPMEGAQIWVLRE